MDRDDINFNKIKNKLNIKKKEHCTSIILKIIDIKTRIYKAYILFFITNKSI
jgi:hypothetical protein